MASAAAQDLSGFAEVRSAFLPGVDGPVWQLVERFRPTLEVPVGKRVVAVSTVELAFTQGRDSQVQARRALEDSDVGPLLDLLDVTWSPDTEVRTGLAAARPSLLLERLYVDVYAPWFDLRVGRQALQWGSALLVNPTDPFPEVLFTDPWRLRKGSNAVRLTVPIGDRHQVQAVVALDDAFQAVRVAGRGTLNVGGFDLSAVSAWRQDDGRGLAGIDVRGTAVVGLWLEGAVHIGGGAWGEDSWEELVVGLDYSFPVLQSLYLAGQYVRNGRGQPELSAEDFLGRLQPGEPLFTVDPTVLDGLGGGLDRSPLTDALLGAQAREPNPPTLLGRDYLMLVARLAVVQEVTVSLVLLQNVGDGTGVVVPTLSTRPTAWLSVEASAQVPYQLTPAGGEFRPPASLTQLELQPVEGLAPLEVDLSGLVPEATVSVWARVSF